MNKNEIYESVIEGYASDASGICHIDGMTVFVPGSLAGEKLKIKHDTIVKPFEFDHKWYSST